MGVCSIALSKWGVSEHFFGTFRNLVHFLSPLKYIILLINTTFNFIFLKESYTVCSISHYSLTNDIYLLQCSGADRKCHCLPQKNFVNFSEMCLSSFAWGEKKEKNISVLKK